MSSYLVTIHVHVETDEEVFRENLGLNIQKYIDDMDHGTPNIIYVLDLEVEEIPENDTEIA